jgi:hypothetical protein
MASSNPLWLTIPQAVSAIVTTAVAVAVATWGYFRFFHRRSWTLHVRIDVSGSLNDVAGVRFAEFTVLISNPGDVLLTLVADFESDGEPVYSGVRVEGLMGADMKEMSSNNYALVWDFIDWAYGARLAEQRFASKPRHYTLPPGRVWEFPFVVPIPWAADVVLVGATVGAARGKPKTESDLNWKPKSVERFGAERVLVYETQGA